MIEIQNLVKVKGNHQILNDLSFTARPGRITGFLGPNGAGKSSTLRILLGLDKATKGQALIYGKSFSEIEEPLRTIGAVFDGSGAHPQRTARNHLKWVCTAAGIDYSRIDEVLDFTNIREAADRRVGKYSLGMSKRLGIATAILGNPKVLILDEPMNGLDPDGIRWIRGFVRDRADEGKIVLMSSHLMSELQEVVDDVVIINKGRLLAEGSINSILSKHSSLEDYFFNLVAKGD